MKHARMMSTIVFAFFGAIACLFSFGELFGDRRTDEHWLAATFGPGMGLFGLAIAVTAFRRGERWAWIAMLVWPVFFAVHVAVFGTWLPDGAFFALAVAALALTGSGLREPRELREQPLPCGRAAAEGNA